MELIHCCRENYLLDHNCHQCCHRHYPCDGCVGQHTVDIRTSMSSIFSVLCRSCRNGVPYVRQGIGVVFHMSVNTLSPSTNIPVSLYSHPLFGRVSVESSRSDHCSLGFSIDLLLNNLHRAHYLHCWAVRVVGEN